MPHACWSSQSRSGRSQRRSSRFTLQFRWPGSPWSCSPPPRASRCDSYPVGERHRPAADPSHRRRGRSQHLADATVDAVAARDMVDRHSARHARPTRLPHHRRRAAHRESHPTRPRIAPPTAQICCSPADTPHTVIVAATMRPPWRPPQSGQCQQDRAAYEDLSATVKGQTSARTVARTADRTITFVFLIVGVAVLSPLRRRDQPLPVRPWRGFRLWRSPVGCDASTPRAKPTERADRRFRAQRIWESR